MIHTMPEGFATLEFDKYSWLADMQEGDVIISDSFGPYCWSSGPAPRFYDVWKGRRSTRDTETSFWHEPLKSFVKLRFDVQNPEITEGRFNYILRTKTVSQEYIP